MKSKNIKCMHNCLEEATHSLKVRYGDETGFDGKYCRYHLYEELRLAMYISHYINKVTVRPLVKCKRNSNNPNSCNMEDLAQKTMGEF